MGRRYNINQLPSGKEDDKIIEGSWKYAHPFEDLWWVLFIPVIAALGYIVYEILKWLAIILIGLFLCAFWGC